MVPPYVPTPEDLESDVQEPLEESLLVEIIPLLVNVEPDDKVNKLAPRSTVPPTVVVKVPFTVISPLTVFVPDVLLTVTLLKVPDGIVCPPAVAANVIVPDVVVDP
jgi:hypothetical protein